jgi:polysaccharide export outer membrane protein
MKDFNRASTAQSINLVEATMQDAAATHDAPTRTGFDPSWQSAPPTSGGLIGTGDILSVSFFERDGLNLFATGNDGNARIDGLRVDPSGIIQLPYAGDVHVAGLTPAEARRAIIGR